MIYSAGNEIIYRLWLQWCLEEILMFIAEPETHVAFKNCDPLAKCIVKSW